MGTLDIKWGSKVTPSEIIYTPGNETFPKTKLGVITDHVGDKYLVTDEIISKGDKYYHFIDGDGLIHIAGSCTLTLAHLNALLDVKKLKRWQIKLVSTPQLK